MVDRRTGAVDERSWANMVALSGYCYEAVAARKGCPGSGLGDLVISGDIPTNQGQKPLSDIERAENLTLLQITGLEQPRNIIAGGIAAFAQHPDQWRALRSDRSLLPGAVEEVLRWTPANPYNRRTATRDLEISGKLIRRGDKVTLWWASANRDEAVFDDPMRFDIRRDPNPHLSFGDGPHLCAGAEIGRMQTRLVLETLLDRVEVIRPAGPVIWGPNNKHCVLLDVPVHLVP
jgi:cytochrome P450